ncbi:hypothetical protein JCM10213_006244 [Rhodosporidiobolus nylandii]
MPKSSALSLEEQFTFYASYHTNLTNVLIHVVCVPTIFATTLILTHGLPGFSTSFATLPPFELLGTPVEVDLTVPFLTAAGYAAYFVLLEPVAGLLYAPLLLTVGHLSNVLYSTQHDQAMKLAGWAFAASWIAQFVGHGKFEHRAPALLDSLLQSLVLAVFFVWLEVFFFLGYRPALHRRLQAKTSAAVADFRRKREQETVKGKAPRISLLSLPRELLAHILAFLPSVSFLARIDLVSCARTCRALLPLAYDQLYNNLEFELCNRSSSTQALFCLFRREWPLVRGLSEQNAGHVRRLELSIFDLHDALLKDYIQEVVAEEGRVIEVGPRHDPDASDDDWVDDEFSEEEWAVVESRTVDVKEVVVQLLSLCANATSLRICDLDGGACDDFPFHLGRLFPQFTSLDMPLLPPNFLAFFPNVDTLSVRTWREGNPDDLRPALDDPSPTLRNLHLQGEPPKPKETAWALFFACNFSWLTAGSYSTLTTLSIPYAGHDDLFAPSLIAFTSLVDLTVRFTLPRPRLALTGQPDPEPSSPPSPLALPPNLIRLALLVDDAFARSAVFPPAFLEQTTFPQTISALSLPCPAVSSARFAAFLRQQSWPALKVVEVVQSPALFWGSDDGTEKEESEGDKDRRKAADEVGIRLKLSIGK